MRRRETMKKTTLAVLAIAAVLLVAGASAATALPVGTRGTVSADLAKYFTDKGVDAQYLNVDPATVPANVMGKINDVLTTVDDTADEVATGDTSYLYHTNLVNLINASLGASWKADDAPVYLELGRVVYEAETGANPYAGLENPAAMAAVDPGAWVSLN
jgi:hypothetical protein